MRPEEAWKAFRQEVTWFVHNRPNARPVASRPPGSWAPRSADFTSLFPELAGLLAEAWLTDVEHLSERWVLYSWEAGGQWRGWLSPGAGILPAGLHPHHRVLLESFAGMVESFGPLSSWIDNHNAWLTAALAEEDTSFVEAYAWAFEETGGIPIDLEDYYVVAQEANGNATLCHRSEGGVLLFAPDHAFDYVTVLAGCPEYTLHGFQGAPTFTSWVERVAGQWRAAP